MQKHDYIKQLKQELSELESRIETVEPNQVDIDAARDVLEEEGFFESWPKEIAEDVGRITAKVWIKAFRKMLEDHGDEIFGAVLAPDK